MTGPKSPPSRSHSGHGKLLKKGKLKRRPPTIRSSFQVNYLFCFSLNIIKCKYTCSCIIFKMKNKAISKVMVTVIKNLRTH